MSVPRLQEVELAEDYFFSVKVLKRKTDDTEAI